MNAPPRQRCTIWSALTTRMTTRSKRWRWRNRPSQSEAGPSCCFFVWARSTRFDYLWVPRHAPRFDVSAQAVHIVAQRNQATHRIGAIDRLGAEIEVGRSEPAARGEWRHLCRTPRARPAASARSYIQRGSPCTQ